MDMQNVIGILKGAASGVNLVQGVIVSCEADYTCTVTIGGSSTQVAGVKVASHVCPVPGATCWILVNGRDMWVTETLAPAGPAYGSMRKSTAQTVAGATWTALTWGSRTDTKANGITLGSSGMTVVVPGIYSLNLTAAFEDAGDTTWPAWSIYATIEINGTTVAGSGGPAPGTATFMSRTNVAATAALAVGDVVGANVYQNSGGNLSTNVSDGYNVLRATWLGPLA